MEGVTAVHYIIGLFSFGNLLATGTILFRAGAWSARTDTRLSVVEDDVREIRSMLREAKP